MRPIKVMFDEGLLRQLDADDEVRRDGRSAVLRRAAAEYLRRRRSRCIKAAYASAYGSGHGLGDEFSGWVREGPRARCELITHDSQLITAHPQLPSGILATPANSGGRITD